MTQVWNFDCRCFHRPHKHVPAIATPTNLIRRQYLPRIFQCSRSCLEILDGHYPRTSKSVVGNAIRTVELSELQQTFEVYRSHADCSNAAVLERISAILIGTSIDHEISCSAISDLSSA